MASIKFKDVVSFSSQDPVHKVFNLLEQNSQFKRWLCAPEEKSGRLQAEFQLEKASRIGFVDIGNFGSAFVEVQVRRSSWPESRSVTMIPATMMMSPQDSKMGKNKCSVKMFTQNQLTEESTSESWDRVKVLCTQPYKKEAQFGLAFIRLAAVSAVKEDRSPESLGPTMTRLASPSLTPSNQPTKKKSILAPSWKTNAVFHRQVIATTQKEENNNPDLKNRLLKMSATSENGTDKEGCLSRSAKLVMAAASGKKSRHEFIMSPARQDTLSSPGLSKKTSPAQVSNGRLLSGGSPKFNFGSSTTENCKYGGKATPGCDRVAGISGETQKLPAARKSFSDMVKDFLKSATDEKLKHTTLKAIRKEFEQSIGRKLNTAEKSELKAKAILAVTGGPDHSSGKPTHPNHRQSHSNANVTTSSKLNSTAQTPTSKYTPKYQSFTTPNRRISTAVAESSYKNTPRHSNFRSPHRPNSSAQSSQTKNTPKYTPGRMTDNKSSSLSPPVTNSSQHRHIPKSQRKRPHSPDDLLGQFKSSRRSSGSGRDSDVNAPTLLQGSTTSASKVPPSTSRTIPPWMTATVNHLADKNGLNLVSATGTPTRCRGRRTSLLGERKSCDKCNKKFTAAGIARHMAKCKGPKPNRHSTGRGRATIKGSEKVPSYDLATNLPEVTSMTANPGSSNSGPSQITDSNFGLMTTDLVKCPVCLKDFPVTLIELHASMCGERDVIPFEGGPNMGMGVTANPIWIE